MDSDWSLMQRIARRDAAALAELYDRHATHVYSLCAAILRNDAAADEVTQDVFLKLWNRPERYAYEQDHFLAWLMLIARRTSIDRLRHDKRQDAVSMAFDDDLIQQAPDIADIAETRWREMMQVMDSLPDEQRAVIELAYYHGLSHVDIAAHLRMPLGTVKTRMRLGIDKLRATLFATKDVDPNESR